MADKIRVGIIGANANYGWSKRAHLPALLALPQFELAAVCTSRAETAEESANSTAPVWPSMTIRKCPTTRQWTWSSFR